MINCVRLVPGNPQLSNFHLYNNNTRFLYSAYHFLKKSLCAWTPQALDTIEQEELHEDITKVVLRTKQMSFQNTFETLGSIDRLDTLGQFIPQVGSCRLKGATPIKTSLYRRRY